MKTTRQATDKGNTQKRKEQVYIGLDIGSVAVKAVLIRGNCSIIWSKYIRHKGHPYQTAFNLLHDAHLIALETATPSEQYIAVTGSSGKNAAKALGAPFVNEVQAQVTATAHLYPEVRTIIEIGGEDAKLISVSENGIIADFSLNSACAAGTGSFLDQQAERLGLTIEQFAQTAYSAEKTARVAGRCSVFAKSDMIHLQQIATPLPNIVSGLCYAVARNFKGAIAKSRQIAVPISFHGGVASNAGMVRAFKDILGCQEINVPPHHAIMTALGAAIYAKQQGDATLFDPKDLKAYAETPQETTQSHPKLRKNGHMQPVEDVHQDAGKTNAPQHKTQTGYLGIDIGSISTNLAVIDPHGNVIAKRYLMTAGNPIEAVRTGLREIGQELGKAVKICAVGTTGSGRYMIADYVGADIVRNEITAQATAAMFIDPTVDTVFEIGGQDSKYISLNNGAITDFEMNKACAAGTGSFLEEQAEKLAVAIKGEFAEAAFSSDTPCKLGERCTVFMENSIAANLSRGANKSDLLAGLAYSIVQNYITKVVGNKAIGNNIFFQGGVAFNKSVISAFESYLETKITVPPHHDVTGAIGMALIARDEIDANPRETLFKGFSLAHSGYDISSFDCTSCPNVCQVNRVRIHGEQKMLFYGSRCEKYDHSKKPTNPKEDLFAYRENALWDSHARRSESLQSDNKPTIGLPYIFFFHDTLPFWSTLLWELGFNVKVSPKTNREVIRAGSGALMVDSCFPVKAANGHIATLINSGIDRIFMPSFVSLSHDTKTFESSFACPLTQAIPYTAKGSNRNTLFISPPIHMARGEAALFEELLMQFKAYGTTKKRLNLAIEHAKQEQHNYEYKMLKKGDEILSKTQDTAVVIIGRSYNALDEGLNLAIPKKLAQLGVTPIPMDMIRTNPAEASQGWANMYWRSGQKILATGNAIAKHKNLYPIYISSFLCGPDSFILKYFYRELKGKPFLNIEIDEHTADAGVITRCEAFLDSIAGRATATTTQPDTATVKKNGAKPLTEKRVYIPNMSDHSILIASAFQRCGINAEALPEPNSESVDIGRKYATGKECYPYLLTTGDMVKCLQAPGFNPSSTVFMMPSGSGPCRFGQYNVCQSMILKDLGYPDIPITAPTQDWRFYKDITSYAKDIPTRGWQAILAGDLLTKHLHQSRPYETQKGTADSLYQHHLSKISRAMADPKGNIEKAIAEMSKDFAQMPKQGPRKPLIGIVGEIYVRSNRFANDDLIRKAEDLGMEVHLSPLSEWIHYIGFTGSRRARYRGDRKTSMVFFIKQHIQNTMERKYDYLCHKSMRKHEPTIGTILTGASPYIHDSLEGEAAVSIGSSIHFAHHGASGIINLMPFGCMPGSIVAALLRCVTRDHAIPHISIAYDGTESPVTQIQLEAFATQVKSYHQHNKTEAPR